MNEVLEFIRLFDSEDNRYLFTEKACYYFAVILQARFPYPRSTIVYNPSRVHFATEIDGDIYDITGLVDDSEDYIDWNQYFDEHVDAEQVAYECIDIIH